jgi:8-oxo-dGTP pyrophosphatase MutT (NUDIX family)
VGTVAQVTDFDPTTVPIRPAATVMLVRDAIDGLEVFMLRRTLAAAFASGMYVFPGGRVDDADHAEELEPICDGLDDDVASARLGIDRGGLAYWVAAIRECFEEAGVLLARPVDHPEAVRFDDPAVAARFEVAREAVHAGDQALAHLCETEGLLLVTDAIHYVSHWITPVGEARRFDTRFFVARAPQAQEPLHDDTETIESLWVRPGDALDRFRAGDLAMIPPTIANLEFLLPFERADDALAAAAALPRPPAILPKLRLGEDGRFGGISVPGDADYDALS